LHCIGLVTRVADGEVADVLAEVVVFEGYVFYVGGFLGGVEDRAVGD